MRSASRSPQTERNESRLPSSTSRWYEAHVLRFGYGYRALGFGRRASQEKRFGAILGLGELHGASLLDVGCGFGDLLAWLNARGVQPRYTGVDLCPPMVAHCRKRFAGSDARFMTGDALTFEPFEPAAPADFVVASGIFGLAARDARARVRPTLARLFGFCRVGLAVNFLSSRAPRRAPARLHLEPGEMLNEALALTPAVRLDHSYLPNDFTLLLYRTPAWQEES